MVSVGKLFAMEHFRMSAMIVLLSVFATSNVEGRWRQEPSNVGTSTIKGKVFRSDSNEAISNSYILLEQEKDSPAQAEHFDLRTDRNGNYRVIDIPAGKYTVSVSAWFPKKSDVPCQNTSEAKATEDGKVTVEWQYKSQEFMEIVTIKGFSVEASHEKVKDFNLSCK
jgi:hypothetical protein